MNSAIARPTVLLVQHAAVCGMLLFAVAPVAAQPVPAPAPGADAAPAATLPRYAELKADEKVRRDLSRLGNGTIPRMLRDTEDIDKRFDDYFTKFLFANMTQLDNLEKLPALRDDLAEFFNKAKSTQSITDRLNRLSLDWLRGIVRGTQQATTRDGDTIPILVVKTEENGRSTYYTMGFQEVDASKVQPRKSRRGDFHPAVKYNAMYLIGQLNDRVARRNSPVVPHLKALEPLLRVARSSRAGESIRVAAMIGVQRHAEVDYAPGIKKLIADSMLAVVKEKPVMGRSPEGQKWIRRQAIDALGSLGIAGAGGNVADAIAAVLIDDQQPIGVRMAASEALGRIQLKSPPKPNVAALTQGLGTLVIDACHHELNRDDKRVSRSRMLDTLRSTTVGLEGPVDAEGKGGLAALAAVGAEGDLIARLTTDVKAMSSSLDDDTKSADQLRRDLTSQCKKIQSYVRGSATPGNE